LPKDLLGVLQRIKQAGHEAYVVGGGVRDSLLGRPTKDWDITTSAGVSELERIFSDRRAFTLKDKTVSIVSADTLYEITPYRGNPPSLLKDLSLRDFTIDATAYDPATETILDPHGGCRDLRNKIVRCVGEPHERFREDPLRLLRAVRLASQLRFRIEERTFKAISALRGLITEVAPERIRDEIVKLILVKRPSLAMRILIKTGLMEIIMPELMEGYRKRQPLPHRHTVLIHSLLAMDHVPPDPVLRLAALLHDVGKPRARSYDGRRWHFYGHEKIGAEMASLMLDRMRFSRETKELVTHLISGHMVMYDPSWSDAAVRRLLVRTGAEHIKDLLLLLKADILAQGSETERAEVIDDLGDRLSLASRQLMGTGKRILAIDGRDVMNALKIAPGPLVGRILDELKEAVIDDPTLNERETLLRLLENKASMILDC
jgi:poly(A) polymerase/tRNA nucleotidyltransferase (CCA-adding enzyme)